MPEYNYKARNLQGEITSGSMFANTTKVCFVCRKVTQMEYILRVFTSHSQASTDDEVMIHILGQHDFCCIFCKTGGSW